MYFFISVASRRAFFSLSMPVLGRFLGFARSTSPVFRFLHWIFVRLEVLLCVGGEFLLYITVDRPVMVLEYISTVRVESSV
jgi:hypothetical protein